VFQQRCAGGERAAHASVRMWALRFRDGRNSGLMRPPLATNRAVGADGERFGIRPVQMLLRTRLPARFVLERIHHRSSLLTDRYLSTGSGEPSPQMCSAASDGDNDAVLHLLDAGVPVDAAKWVCSLIARTAAARASPPRCLPIDCEMLLALVVLLCEAPRRFLCVDGGRFTCVRTADCTA
jgi:hypothetical protein